MINVDERQVDRLTEAFHHLLNGMEAPKLELPPDHKDDEVGQCIEFYNRFANEYNALTAYMYALSRGELHSEVPKGRIQVLHSYKSLHANLRHLTWKTQQIAKGDFNHNVDFIGDFSVAFNDMTRQLKDSFEKIQMQNQQLTDANQIIDREREKSDLLLRNVLPDSVVDELKEQGSSTPQLYKDVAVFFSDFVGFTRKSEEIPPDILIQELSAMFSAFDCIVEASYGERIKTMGDAYMAVWGMHSRVEEHVLKAVDASIRMLEFIESRNKDSNIRWELRIGMHVGDVVGGIVGTSKFIYDVFGDAVNIAARMEGHSEPMRINVTESIVERLDGSFQATERGNLYVKGKGDMRMFFVGRGV